VRAPAAAAAAHGVKLEVVKLPDAKRGFVLLPRRWVVERSFAWMARFRRLARDYERLPTTLAGLHFIAFACLMLARITFQFLSSSLSIFRRRKRAVPRSARITLGQVFAFVQRQ
jgi:hypothetical protein